MLRAISTGTSAGSRTAANGTKCTPSGKAPIRLASSIASRVLPQPPGPVSVSRRVRSSRPRACASSLSRPTKLVDGRGNTPDHLTATAPRAVPPALRCKGRSAVRPPLRRRSGSVAGLPRRMAPRRRSALRSRGTLPDHVCHPARGAARGLDMDRAGIVSATMCDTFDPRSEEDGPLRTVADRSASAPGVHFGRTLRRLVSPERRRHRLCRTSSPQVGTGDGEVEGDDTDTHTLVPKKRRSRGHVAATPGYLLPSRQVGCHCCRDDDVGTGRAKCQDHGCRGRH